MKNYIFILICAVFYVIIVGRLFGKAKDIFKNPSKYNIVKGWNQYRQSGWYESRAKYEKSPKSFSSKTNIASGIVFLCIVGGFVVGYCIIGLCIQKYIFLPTNTILLKSEGIFYGMGGTFFLSAFLSEWICCHSSIPIMVASTRSSISSIFRSDDLKSTICILTITSIFALPIMAMGINSYTYLKSDGIVQNKFFSITEEELLFSDVVKAETSFAIDEKENEFQFFYEIVTDDGRKIDLFACCDASELMLIHDKMQTLDISIEKGVIEQSTYEQMKKEVEDVDIVEILPQVFIVEQ